MVLVEPICDRRQLRSGERRGAERAPAADARAQLWLAPKD
jgi:hypothetical protein